MAGHKKDSDRDLEAEWIRELAGILDETGLTEIEIEKDAVRLRISRQGSAVAAMPVPPAPPLSVSPGIAPTPEAGAGASTDHPGAVKSPMVGTAYLSPAPGAEPFTKVGAQVNEGQTIMIVEAMKTMNPIAAPRSGKVTQILVSDAQPVEYEEPLIIIE